MARLFFLILLFNTFSCYADKFYGVYRGTHINLALDSNSHYTIETSYHPIHSHIVFPVLLSIGNYSIKGNMITLCDSFSKIKIKLVKNGQKLFFKSAIPYYQRANSVLEKQDVYDVDDFKDYYKYIKYIRRDSSLLKKCHDSISHKILLGQKYGHWDYDIIFEPKTYKIYCYQTLFTDGTWKQDKNILFIKDNYTHMVHKWYIMNDSNIVTDFFPDGLIVFSTNASDD